MSQALVQVMRKIGHTEAVLVGPKLDNVENVPFMSIVRNYLTASGIGIRDTVEIDEAQFDGVYETVSRIRTTTKCKRYIAST
jgi:hypothetical protein